MAAVERTGSRGFQGYMSRPTSTGDEDDLDSEVQTSDVFPDSIRAELLSIENVIRLTKEKLEDLNAMFGSKRHPPSMYLEEYEILTNKIHRLQEREQQLQEQLSFLDEESGQVSPSTAPETELDYHFGGGDWAPAPSSTTTSATSAAGDCQAGYMVHNLETPLRNAIKAYLPNKQISTLKVKPGQTLSDVLRKGLERRGIALSNCIVFDSNSRQPISWDDDVECYAGKEISVELEYISCKMSNKGHNYVRKTMFSSSCDGCHRMIFQGLKCQICQRKFHAKCDPDSHKGPPYKQPQPEFHHVVTQSRPPLRHSVGHQRSTSVPNVNQLSAEQVPEFPRYFCPPITKNSTNLPASSTLPKGQSYSAQASPTNNAKVRPRARSAETPDNKKLRSRRDSNEEWEIPENDITVGCQIGSGSFGTVFKGQWYGPVAIKKLNVREPTPAQLQAFKNEVAVLRRTRHVNILLFVGCISKPHLAIVTQWCEGSSLYKHLHVNESKFDMNLLIDIARQTAQGMDYLHAKNIIHRDLKSNNIFLADNYCVKIGDFGLATVKLRWSGSYQYQQPSGSVMWMSPEIIRMKDKDPYTFKSDVYAYGIVLFELVSSQLPYKIRERDQIMYMVGNGILRPDISLARKDTPRDFTKLLEECISYNPDKRPLFPEILADVEGLVKRLPKLTKSVSEPTLSRSFFGDESDYAYNCTSPRTPINSQHSYLYPSANYK